MRSWRRAFYPKSVFMPPATRPSSLSRLTPTARSPTASSGWSSCSADPEGRRARISILAISLAPEDPQGYRALATWNHLAGGRDARRLVALSNAIALDPEDADCLAALGAWYFRNRRGAARAEGERLAREALSFDPENADAMVLMGRIHLDRGNVAEAREHAVFVLRRNATDEGALFLMAAVKLRKNPFLALWWRWNTWLTAFRDSRLALVLVAAYAIQRFGVLVAHDNGY